MKVAPKSNWELRDLVISALKSFSYTWDYFDEPNKRCDLNHIDTQYITDFTGIFSHIDIPVDFSSWDTSNGKIFDYMFARSTYNQELTIDTSNAASMVGMFMYSSFNHPSICKLNVSKVKKFSRMFAHSKFNQPIGMLKPYEGVYFDKMFAYSDFDQDLDKFFEVCFCAKSWEGLLMGTKFTSKLPSLFNDREIYTTSMLAGAKLGTNIQAYVNLPSEKLVDMFISD